VSGDTPKLDNPKPGTVLAGIVIMDYTPEVRLMGAGVALGYRPYHPQHPYAVWTRVVQRDGVWFCENGHYFGSALAAMRYYTQHLLGSDLMPVPKGWEAEEVHRALLTLGELEANYSLVEGDDNGLLSLPQEEIISKAEAYWHEHED
jgi:hypothetical protein